MAANRCKIYKIQRYAGKAWQEEAVVYDNGLQALEDRDNLKRQHGGRWRIVVEDGEMVHGRTKQMANSGQWATQYTKGGINL